MKEIGRALLLRCPHCGGDRMFRRWIVARTRCTKCGFRFDRGEDDYYIGAYTINLIIAELFVVGAMLIVIFVKWPDVPWDTLPWMLLGPAVIAPLFTYPFSKSLWLAIDLRFRPAQLSDF